MSRITIADIESVRRELLGIFPDAIRGSEAKSRWGDGKRDLHLAYFIESDTVSGYKIVPCGNLYQLISWDTNIGIEWTYSHHDQFYFLCWVKNYFKGETFGISRTVCG